MKTHKPSRVLGVGFGALGATFFTLAMALLLGSAESGLVAGLAWGATFGLAMLAYAWFLFKRSPSSLPEAA